MNEKLPCFGECVIVEDYEYSSEDGQCFRSDFPKCPKGAKHEEDPEECPDFKECIIGGQNGIS